MTSPNKTNIDQWLFDYFEGNLDPTQEELLEAFLLDNPEYDMDMEAWGGARAVSGVDVYPANDSLKRRTTIIPLFMRWASVFVLLFSSFFALIYLNNQLKEERYSFINLSNTYFASFDDNYEREEFVSETNFNDNLSTGLISVNAANANKSSNLTSASHLNFTNETYDITHARTTTNSERNDYEGSAHYNAEPFVINVESNQAPLKVRAIISEPPVQISAENSESFYDVSLKDDKSEHRNKNSLFKDISRSVNRFVKSDLGLLNLRDPNYMLPGLTPMDVNFGHTGSLLATRVYSNTFVQWPNNLGQSVAMQMGVDTYVKSLGGGIGFQMNYSNYQAGLFQSYEGALTYSPKIKVGKNVILEPAMRFKMGSRRLNADRVVSGQQVEWDRSDVRTIFSDGEAPIGERLLYKDLGLGLLVNTKWAFIGVNVDNLGRHYNSIYANPSADDNPRAALNYIVTAGTDYQSFNKKTALSTYIAYQNFGKLNKGWLGVNYRYRFMTVGASISTDLDPVGSIGLSFDRFKLSYMTDYTMNNVVGKRMLSHQLSIRITSKPSRSSTKLLN